MQDLTEVYKLRYQVYCQEKQYFEDNQLGYEQDAYDEQAEHFLVYSNQELAGYCRLVHATKDLPLLKYAQVDIPEHSAEISRLIIKPEYRGDVSILMHLFHAMRTFSKEQQIDNWYCVSESNLIRKLKRLCFRFNLVKAEVKHPTRVVGIYTARLSALDQQIPSSLLNWFNSPVDFT